MNAQEYLKRAEAMADKLNNQRPLWKKILKKDIVTSMEILYNTATYEYRSRLDDMFDGVMSISLWKNISKNDFLKLITEGAHEVARENKAVTKEIAIEHYKSKALRFAQWLEDTKYRPFFDGSVHEIERVICHIRSIVN